MMTISDIAAKLGVNRAQAYGLVHLLQVKGLLKPVSKKSGAGKGKPASLYQFNHEHSTALAALVDSLVDNQAAPAVEAPTEQTEAPAAAATF